MEEVLGIYSKTSQFSEELNRLINEFEEKTRVILHGEEVGKMALKDLTNLALQPEKKKAKRLTALDECDETRLSSNVPRTKNLNQLDTEATVEEEQEEQDEEGGDEEGEDSSFSKVKRISNKNNKSDENKAPKSFDVTTKSASELMPPPPVAPAAVTSTSSDQSFSRPQRAAKLNCEKNLKEPPLRTKLRRPSKNENAGIKVKLEQESRVSQMNERTETQNRSVSQDSVVVVPPKEISTMTIDSQVEETPTNPAPHSTENKIESDANISKNLRIRIKREKLSNVNEQSSCSNKTEAKTLTQPKGAEATHVDSSIAASILSVSTANTTQSKKGRAKKKVFPKPIKVERISNAGENSSNESIASRTRQKEKSFERENESLITKQSSMKDVRDGASLYEEALENLQTSANEATTKHTTESVNATMTLTKQENTNSSSSNHTVVLETAPNDATYCTANAATFVLDTQNVQNAQGEGSDLTFNIANEKATDSQHSSMQSMATARDTQHQDSLITEDDSFECPETPVPINKVTLPAQPSATKLPANSNVKLNFSAKKYAMPNKICKMPTRTIEIFNPLVQSPVKKKVEAYENAAAAQAASVDTLRSTRSKQTTAHSQKKGNTITPQIGKLPKCASALSLGRCANLTPNVKAQAKLIPASASKTQGLRKSNSSGDLKIKSSSAKAPSRGKSVEDFRRGLHQMAEDRKKQREQKHLLAAQQREAKERERAERMAKVAKEREEKRLKKQQESEQRRRDLEEIQRKLRVQEEAAAADIAKQKSKFVEQEKAMLQQIKPHPGSGKAKARMPPPQPKTQSKYTFEMLHEDDSTDDEDKISYKRPPPPEWSRSHIRWMDILMQQVMPAIVVDNFFSVEPMTPDLKIIFPGISSRHLQRNSSVLWSTPPRYSELPKY